MPKFFKTASTRISKDMYEAFEKKCETEGCTVHTDLKEYIERRIKDVGRKENGLESGMGEGNKGIRGIESGDATGSKGEKEPAFLRA